MVIKKENQENKNYLLPHYPALPLARPLWSLVSFF